jgi:hypothetical protein
MKEGNMSVCVELLASSFCMADRDSKTVGRICRETGAHYRLLNMWDIDDCMDGVPHHVASLVRQYRSGQRPGNFYGNAFVNGERVLLDRWPSHLEDIRTLIERAKKEGAQ